LENNNYKRSSRTPQEPTTTTIAEDDKTIRKFKQQPTILERNARLELSTGTRTRNVHGAAAVERIGESSCACGGSNDSPVGRRRSGRGEERDHHPVDYHQQTSREMNERSSDFPEQQIRDELIGLDFHRINQSMGACRSKSTMTMTTPEEPNHHKKESLCNIEYQVRIVLYCCVLGSRLLVSYSSVNCFYLFILLLL
jgi:hypothetical protein